MLFVSINNLDLIHSVQDQAVGIEIRCDLLPEISIEKIEQAMKFSKNLFLLTLRSSCHGGKCTDSMTQRMELIKKLLSLHPTFMDLEWDLDPNFIKEQILAYPNVKFILSHHNFTTKPVDIEQTYYKMCSFSAFHYKIATCTNSTSDTLSLFLLAKKHPKLSLIPMGEKGSFGRVLSLTLQDKIHYTCLSTKEPTAPGQVPLEDLVEIYRYPRLNPNTQLYGLIGDPISKSIGHIYHNNQFCLKNYNALYLKMAVAEEELSCFFPLAKEVGFKGLSVTMPLKEKVLPFIEELDETTKPIAATNTLLFKKNQIFGTNTDGKGALDAIEQQLPVQNKKLVILGAGGACKAIAFEAIRRGAKVYIANRTKARASILSDQLGCDGGDLSSLPAEYDILINTSPASLPVTDILSSATVMDINYNPRETPFLNHALSLGCKVVFGDEMFYKQANLQANLFMPAVATDL